MVMPDNIEIRSLTSSHNALITLTSCVRNAVFIVLSYSFYVCVWCPLAFVNSRNIFIWVLILYVAGQ